MKIRGEEYSFFSKILENFSKFVNENLKTKVFQKNNNEQENIQNLGGERPPATNATA